jgi:outer membrane protein
MTRLLVRSMRAAAAAACALLIARGAAAQQPGQPTQALRFAWLNSQAVLSATPGRADAESLFAREMTGFRAEVQRLQAQLDSSLAEYNRAAPAMSPQAKTQREEQLRQMETRNRQRAQELDQQAQSREAELTAPIMQRVNAVIEGVRAEFNFAFVFDVAAQGNPIITADRALDITQLIIQRLQAAGMPPASTPGAVQPAGQPPLRPAPGDSAAPATPVPAPAGPRLRPRPTARP